MNISNLSALVLLLLGFDCFAQIQNGDFEHWTAGTPSAWTTIDSGISISSSTAPRYEGSYAAHIQVNTSSQASTDIRQSISVIAGTTYSVSVRVYHTEGGVRARLYVDGYQNYSSEALLNQWQQIDYSYTAATSGNIEVGLRFYDTSGFDGSESVYIDDFQPGSSTTNPPNDCSDDELTLHLETDNYGSETSWQLTDSASAVMYSGDNYASNTVYEESLCLAPGAYTFTIFDSYGDGICCSFGQGSYALALGASTVASGGNFGGSESSSFTTSGDIPSADSYYDDAQGLSGFSLKSALHDIIKDHSNQGYGALWTFYQDHERDRYYENDGSILDIYSERPTTSDPYTFSAVTDQCGNYQGEGDCYNREHSFPRSWFGGQEEPMNSDVHHIFASDGFVNSQRGSYPYGEVASASFTSNNGSALGSASAGIGYSGTVFEPIDEFKGDLARAQFYIATRYQNLIANWEGNSSSSNAVLDGSALQVFESWYLELLKQWHEQDPVSQKELDRNNAAYEHQGNRNPFVDHPEFVSDIWGS